MTEARFTSLMRSLLPLIDSRERARFGGICLLNLTLAANELAITGLIGLFAAVFSSPDAVHSHSAIIQFQRVAPFSLPEDQRSLALFVIIAIFAAILVKNSLTVFQQWHVVRFSQTIHKQIKSRIMLFQLRAPFLFLQGKGSSQLLFNFTVGDSLLEIGIHLLSALTNIVIISVLCISIFYVSHDVAIIFSVIFYVVGYSGIKVARKSIYSYSMLSFAAAQNIHAIQQITTHALKELRIARRLHAAYLRYSVALQEYSEAKQKQFVLMRLPVCSLEVMGFGTMVLAMLFLVYVQDAGMARISGLMAFMAGAAWRVLPAANRLTESVNSLRSGLPQLRLLVELFREEARLRPALVPANDQDAPPMRFTRSLRLDNISFRYSDALNPALDAVSLTIKAGTAIGVVGSSGAGKSTLVNVLTGLVPPQSGQILVDDVPVTESNVAAWMGCMGYVAQAPYILDASLVENVALRDWGGTPDRERVRDCCRMASLDFLDELENGLDTILGDKGTRLSGGQLQRVAIARALYADPPIIVFDEATSSLDMHNEAAIQQTIFSLRGRMTMVIIAHRLSTVEHCDSIVWLESGKVRMHGPAATVLARYHTMGNSS